MSSCTLKDYGLQPLTTAVPYFHYTTITRKIDMEVMLIGSTVAMCCINGLPSIEIDCLQMCSKSTLFSSASHNL